MRTLRVVLVACIGFLLSPRLTYAQLNCGSNGLRGPLVVLANQTVPLDIPDDGVFNFTTVSVSGTLLFKRNPSFNPPVVILATGDVTVSGTIAVNGSASTSINWGAGGPGGFDGGAPGIGGANPGAGHGPGAGGAGIGSLSGGNAGYGEPGQSTLSTNGVAYGSPLLVPLAGGSGGGGNDNVGGGGGGGAILLCSPSQVTIGGTVDALGGNGSGANSNGSGGAIRIVSPAVRGNGSLRVTGGGSGYGGHGRVRIDTIDRTGLATSTTAGALSIGSLMAVFPSTIPRLDVVRVAGNAIAMAAASPLVFTLPFNSPAAQSITVRATNFTGKVPITVAVTPESGNRILLNTEIDADVAPAETTVTVDLPQNITVRVHAWTR